MLWLLSFLLIVVCAAGLYLMLRRDRPSLTQAFVSLGVTVVGTLVGVLLALDLTNRSSYKSEGEIYTALTQAAGHEIAVKSDNLRSLYRRVQDDSSESAKDLLDTHPVTGLAVMAHMVESESFYRHTSPVIVSLLVQAKEGTETDAAGINDHDSALELRAQYMYAYIGLLEMARRLLDIQRDLNSGNIDLTTAESKARNIQNTVDKEGVVAFIPSIVTRPK